MQRLLLHWHYFNFTVGVPFISTGVQPVCSIHMSLCTKGVWCHERSCSTTLIMHFSIVHLYGDCECISEYKSIMLAHSGRLYHFDWAHLSTHTLSPTYTTLHTNMLLYTWWQLLVPWNSIVSFSDLARHLYISLIPRFEVWERDYVYIIIQYCSLSKIWSTHNSFSDSLSGGVGPSNLLPWLKG